MGLSFDETLTLPVGELLTLISIEQIKTEGAKEAEDFFELLGRE
jgi:hypothetical protein